jgi:hypothetical protein
MFYVKSIFAGAAMFAIAASANAQSAGSSTVEVSAKLVTSITVNTLLPMNFGSIVLGSGVGNVVLSTESERVAGGGVTLGNVGSTGAASVVFTGDANSTFSVTLGALGGGDVVLVNTSAPEKQLSLTNFLFRLVGSAEAAYETPFAGAFSETGNATLRIGGRLNIPASSPAGAYSTGVSGGKPMTVTVNYN